MTEIFMFAFNAVMPILLLVALGYILKILHFAPDSFFKKVNTMVFRVFLPILLFENVYEIESLSAVNWSVVVYCGIAVIVIMLFGWLVSKLVTKEKGKIAVLTQCSFRSNHAIIGLPIAQSLGGAPAVAFASIISAVAIPLYNILAVIILSYYSSGSKKPGIKKTLIRTVKNPLIIGVMIGVAVLAVRSLIPVGADGLPVFLLERDCPFVMKAVKSLAGVASPLALVVLGARFDFSAVKSLAKEISVGVVLRLIVAPVVSIGFAYILSSFTQLISVTAVEYPAMVSLFASPVAVSSAVMVGEIGGDDQLAAQLVVWTSAMSMLTIFIIVFFMKSFNLL